MDDFERCSKWLEAALECKEINDTNLSGSC